MESEKGGHAMTGQSALGRLREQIDDESRAAFQGLHGFSQRVSELGPQGAERSQAGQKESDGSNVSENFIARR